MKLDFPVVWKYGRTPQLAVRVGGIDNAEPMIPQGFTPVALGQQIKRGDFMVRGSHWVEIDDPTNAGIGLNLWVNGREPSVIIRMDTW